jgi:hypothetical protein
MWDAITMDRTADGGDLPRHVKLPEWIRGKHRLLLLGRTEDHDHHRYDAS